MKASYALMLASMIWTLSFTAVAAGGGGAARSGASLHGNCPVSPGASIAGPGVASAASQPAAGNLPASLAKSGADAARPRPCESNTTAERAKT